MQADRRTGKARLLLLPCRVAFVKRRSVNDSYGSEDLYDVECSNLLPPLFIQVLGFQGMSEYLHFSVSGSRTVAYLNYHLK